MSSASNQIVTLVNCPRVEDLEAVKFELKDAETNKERWEYTGEENSSRAWIDTTRTLGHVYLIGPNMPRNAELSARFKGTLLAPQLACLVAMQNLEITPWVRYAGRVTCLMLTHNVVLANPAGTGKTVIMLALLCSPVQPIVREVVYSDYEEDFSTPMAELDLTMLTFKPSQMYDSTVLIARADLLRQWQAEAARFTDLTVRIIDDVRDLKQFYEDFKTNFERPGSRCDLLMVKHGKVTKRFALDGEKPEDGDRQMVDVFGQMFAGVVIRRLIVDEWDTMDNQGTRLPVALMRWLVSATEINRSSAGRDKKNMALDPFTVARESLSHLLACDLLKDVFKIMCTKDFTADFKCVPLKYSLYTFNAGKGRELFKDMGFPEEVINMLSAGALSTAVAQLGMSATSPAEILRLVLQKHRHEIERVLSSREAVYHVCQTLGIPADRTLESIVKPVALPIMPATLASIKETEVAALVAFKTKAIMKLVAANLKAREEKTAAESEEPSMPYSAGKILEGISHLPLVEQITQLADAGTKLYADLKQARCALNRARENVRSGECQVCCLPLRQSMAYVFANCCQVVACEDCTRGRSNVLVSYCVMCQKKVTPLDIVVLNFKQDDEDTSTENLDVEISEMDAFKLAVDKPVVALAGTGERVLPPKIAAILAILAGKEVTTHKALSHEPFVENLLSGPVSVPRPAGAPVKMLIFTLYKESTDKLDASLREVGVHGLIYAGNADERGATLARFEDPAGPNIMFITSSSDCAGLNMAFLSHVVMYHEVHDKQVATKITARGQRLGRTFDLEVVKFIDDARA